MRSRLAATVALTALVITPGCSSIIVSGGKSPPHFTSNDTRKTVEKDLGRPRTIHEYSPPTTLASVPEFIELTPRLQKEALAVTNKVASREEFVFRSWIQGPADGDVRTEVAASSLASFGLLELYNFPASLVYATGKTFERHRIRIWFSEDGHFLLQEWTPGYDPDAHGEKFRKFEQEAEKTVSGYFQAVSANGYDAALADYGTARLLHFTNEVMSTYMAKTLGKLGVYRNFKVGDWRVRKISTDSFNGVSVFFQCQVTYYNFTTIEQFKLLKREKETDFKIDYHRIVPEDYWTQ